MLSELTIKEFLEKIASDSPAPGGGSVAALSAAVAAGLIEMVANLTIGKEGYESVESEMKAVAQNAIQLRNKLIKAIDDDSDAYRQVFSAFKLPEDTEEDKLYREKMIQSGLKQAALIPMAVAEDAALLIELAGKAVAMGNKFANTDGAVGIMMAKTAVLSAIYNVKVNLVSIKDNVFKERISKRITSLEIKTHHREKELLSAVDL